jgi:hypothetical protein
MMSVLIGLVLSLVLATVGCATDEGERASGTSNLDNGGMAGSVGTGDFGNSTTANVPPPPTGAVVTEGSGNGCKAGHYLGQLWGTYVSPAAVGFTPDGVPVSTDPMALDAAVLNSLFPPAGGSSPGFEFWLHTSDEAVEVVCEPDDEFCIGADFKVEGGIAKGVANGLFPFQMEINGSLNCGAGEFHGLVENGWYEVAGIRFMYEGTIDASYDKDMAAFFDGTWIVAEPADPTAGGEGEWYTALVDDVPPSH